MSAAVIVIVIFLAGMLAGWSLAHIRPQRRSRLGKPDPSCARNKPGAVP